jgi:hypothetical protein
MIQPEINVAIFTIFRQVLGQKVVPLDPMLPNFMKTLKKQQVTLNFQKSAFFAQQRRQMSDHNIDHLKNVEL